MTKTPPHQPLPGSVVTIMKNREGYHGVLAVLALVPATVLVLYLWNFDLRYNLAEPGFAGWGIYGLVWCAVFLLFKPLRFVWRRLMAVPDLLFDAALALLAFLATGAIAHLCFDAMPHVQDEIGYLFQARLLSEGRLSAQSHVLPEFFNFRFLVNDGRWFSLFQPGWPLAMVPFVWLGLPQFAAPFYSALSLPLAMAAGRRVFGRDAARIGGLLMATSPFFLFMSGSMMSHPFALFAAALATYAVIRMVTDPERSWRFALVAGLAGGMLVNTRVATALAILSPLALLGVLHVLRHPAKVPLLAVVLAGFLPGAVLLLCYNHALTGDALVFPQEVYFGLTEDNPQCHTLGLGPHIGCQYEHGPDIHWRDYTPEVAAQVTRVRINSFKGDLFGLGLTMVLLIPALALGGGWAWFFMLLFASSVGVYFFYYYHGLCFGARYYYEAVFAIFLLLGVAVERAVSLLKDGGAGGGLGSRLSGAAAVSLVAALPLFLVGRSVPMVDLPQWRGFDNGFWGVDTGCRDAAQKAGLHHAVVFGPGSDKFYRSCFVFMDHHIDRQDVIYVRDLGRHNENILRHYPDRQPWRYVGGSMVPYRGRSVAPDVFLEAEAKFPAPVQQEGYNRLQHVKSRDMGKVEYLELVAKGPHARFEFTHHLADAGRFHLEISLVEGSSFGSGQLYVDDKPVCPVLDCRQDDEENQVVTRICPEELDLGPGMHRFRLDLLPTEGQGNARLGIDSLLLKAVTPAGESAE